MMGGVACSLGHGENWHSLSLIAHRGCQQTGVVKSQSGTTSIHRLVCCSAGSYVGGRPLGSRET